VSDPPPKPALSSQTGASSSHARDDGLTTDAWTGASPNRPASSLAVLRARSRSSQEDISTVDPRVRQVDRLLEAVRDSMPQRPVSKRTIGQPVPADVTELREQLRANVDLISELGKGTGSRPAPDRAQGARALDKDTSGRRELARDRMN
jgi:hypothetical protein